MNQPIQSNRCLTPYEKTPSVTYKKEFFALIRQSSYMAMDDEFTQIDFDVLIESTNDCGRCDLNKRLKFNEKKKTKQKSC
jgi:hypothetical protein